MGFMDKARKMAEQAQGKLDEVQQQFNEGQQQDKGAREPAVEYDKHGRPVDTAPTTAEQAPPPVPDPVEGVAPAAPPVAPTEAVPPSGAPPEDYTPPKVTHGDPLTG